MTDNLITITTVAASTVITALLRVWSDRKKTQQMKLQREWDVADRHQKNEEVLGAIKENTEVSASAFKVGNNLNEKLLLMDKKLAVAIPDTVRILDDMMRKGGTSVPQSDVAKVLVGLRRDVDRLDRLVGVGREHPRPGDAGGPRL